MAALDLRIVPAGVASAEDKWRESYGGEGYLERTSSEEQCELMMDALRRELGEIKVGKELRRALRSLRGGYFFPIAEPASVADLSPGREL